MPLVYLGLGANLGDREATIRLALARLNEHDGIDVQRVSRLRETDPVGYEDQPRFLNGVARLLFIAKHAEGEAMGPALITLDQHAKRLLISLPGAGHRVAVAHEHDRWRQVGQRRAREREGQSQRGDDVSHAGLSFLSQSS